MNKMYKHLTASLLALCAISPIAEAKNYTKGDLKKMIAHKKYPKTENPRASTHSFDFKMCKTVITSDRGEKEEEGYPVQVVTDKKDLLIVKTWQEHMMTVSTCKEGTGVIENIDYDYAD